MEMRNVHLAQPGERIEVAGLPGNARRSGEVLEVLGEPGHERYRVRWDDRHESVLYPTEAVHVVTER
jgi:hypothetical protein